MHCLATSLQVLVYFKCVRRPLQHILSNRQYRCQLPPVQVTSRLDYLCIEQLLCTAGTVTLPAEIEMVMPGDNVTANFELIAPVAMEAGLRFALREGGRTVGAGVVSEVTA